MCVRQLRRRAAGFTLVELVTVIIVLGILAIGTVGFIGDSARGFSSAMSRGALGSDSRFVVERLSRELQDALPGSVRANGDCVEFVPVVAASRYLTLPIASPSSQFRAVPVAPLPLPAGVRAAVYPGVTLYGLGDPGPVSPPLSVSAPDAANEVTVTLAAPHRFASESPRQRFFLVTDPVSYCVDGGSLYRYQGYGFLALQPSPADLPAAQPGRALLAEGVVAAAPFVAAGATLTRNAIVALDLDVQRGGDLVHVEHLVGVRNAP